MSKPSTAATINSGNALTTNLAAAFLLNEGAGTTAKDYVSGSVNLTLSGGASWSANGIACTTATSRATVTTPAGLKLTLPITLYLRVIPAGAPDAFALLFGTVHNAANASPYISASIDIAGSNSYYLGDGNSGGSYGQAGTTTPITSDVGQTVDIALVFTAANMIIYRNGSVIGQKGTGNSNPTYDSTSVLGFGDLFSLSRKANCDFVFGFIFHADMSASLATIQADPYALFTDVTPPPNAPSSLTLVSIVGNVVNLSWTDNSSDETGWKIYASFDNTDFFLWDTIATGTTTASGIAYADYSGPIYFKVTAYNGAGESTASNTVSGTVSAGGSPACMIGLGFGLGVG